MAPGLPERYPAGSNSQRLWSRADPNNSPLCAQSRFRTLCKNAWFQLLRFSVLRESC